MVRDLDLAMSHVLPFPAPTPRRPPWCRTTDVPAQEVQHRLQSRIVASCALVVLLSAARCQALLSRPGDASAQQQIPRVVYQASVAPQTQAAHACMQTSAPFVPAVRLADSSLPLPQEMVIQQLSGAGLLPLAVEKCAPHLPTRRL